MFAPAPALRRSPRLAALNAAAVGVAPPAPAPPPPAPVQPAIAAPPVVAAPNPAVAANALALARPVEHVSVVQCAADYAHLVLKVDDVERTLQCDRSLIGIWANRSRLQIRRIFDPAASVQIVMSAAKALRVGLETATQYGTAVDAFQNINLTSIGVAKRALNRLSNAVTPISLHSTQRALQLARLERDLWPALLRKASEVDQGNAVLYAECMLDASSAPIQYLLVPLPIRGNRGRAQPVPAAPIALPPALPQVQPPIAVQNPPPAQPVANPVVPAALAPGPVAHLPAPGPAVAQPQAPLPQPPAPANAPPPPAQGRNWNRRASSSSVTGSTGSSSDSEDDLPGAGAVALLPVIPQPAPSQAVQVQPLPAQAPQNASGQAHRSRTRSSSASTGRSSLPASLTGSSSDGEDSDDDFPPGGGAAGAAAGTVGNDLSRIESSRTGSDSDGGQNADDGMSNGGAGADELDDLNMIDGLDRNLMDPDGGAVDGGEVQDILDGVGIGPDAPNPFDANGNVFNGSLGRDFPRSPSIHTAIADDSGAEAENSEEVGEDGESGSGTRAVLTSYDGSEGSGETMTAGIEDGSWDYIPSSVDVPLRNNRSLAAETSDPNTAAAQDDVSLSSRSTRETWRHLSNNLSDRILSPLRPVPGTPHTARSPSVQPEVADVYMDSVSTAVSDEGSLRTGRSVSMEDTVIQKGAVSGEAESMDTTGQKSEEGGEEQEMGAKGGVDEIVDGRSGTMEYDDVDDSTGESFSAGVESGSWDYVPSDVDIPVRIRSIESESSTSQPAHANVSQSTSRETRNTWREMSDRLSDRILSPLGSPTERRIPLYRPYPAPSSRPRTASTQSSSSWTSVRTAEEAEIRSVVTASLASICSATTAQLPPCVTASEVSLANTAEEISASTARSFSATDLNMMSAHTPDEFTMDVETAEELELNGLVSSMSQLSVHTATSGARSPTQELVQTSPSMHSRRKRSSSEEPGEAEGESADKRRKED